MSAMDWDIAVQTDCVVATGGNAVASGNDSDPITLAGVLSLYPTYWAGPTIKLRGGTYTGDFVCRLSGNTNGYITIQSYPGEWAKIDGSLFAEADYVIFKDLEIYDADFIIRDATQGTIPQRDAMRADAPHVKFINCVLHDCRQGILNTYTLSHSIEIYGCVVCFNGWWNTDRGHGHGIYVGNDSDEPLIIKDCIIFNNFAYGLHAYAEGVAEGISSALRNIHIIGCTIFDNVLGGSNQNAIIGGSGLRTTVRDPIVRDCCFYTSNPAINNLQLGGLSTGATDVTLENCVFVGGKFWTNMYNAPISISGNKFYCVVEGMEQYPQNVYSSGTPDFVSLRVNTYDANRANLTIFNGSSAETVTVAVPWTGTVTARNVQDYFNDIQTLTVTDGNITVAMTGRTVAAPQGWEAPASTFPSFGCFVLEHQ